jgi:hypothetical protein
MTDPFSFAPTIMVNITIVIGVSLTLSAAALGLLLRRWWRPRRNPRRAEARWQFDYRSTTGFAVRVSKTPRPRASLPLRRRDAPRFAASQHDNRVNN